MATQVACGGRARLFQVSLAQRHETWHRRNRRVSDDGDDFPVLGSHLVLVRLLARENPDFLDIMQVGHNVAVLVADLERQAELILD